MQPASRKYEVIGIIGVLMIANIIIFVLMSKKLETYVTEYTYDQLMAQQPK